VNHEARSDGRILLPAWMTEVELARPLPDLIPPARQQGDAYVWAHILVRLHGQPLGFVDLPLDRGAVSANAFAAAVRMQLDDSLASHLAADQLEVQELTTAGLPPVDDPPCASPGPYDSHEPPATVVVPTRERPARLRTCLEALLALDYPNFEVVVVDSAPSTDATAKLVLGLKDTRLRYAIESHRGTSRARNRALAEEQSEFIAFTDDDLTVDPGWLRALARGFTRAPTVGCVTGFVVSAELEFESQLLFERRVGWGRSCERRLFDLSSHAVPDPLYPFIAGVFGTGACFAVSREALDRLGGFDEALGPGTPPRGGEDLDFFLRAVLAGMSIAYEPGAIAWHLHRRGEDALRRQLFGYGSGLTAYAFKHLVARETAAAVSRRVPGGIRRLLGGGPDGAGTGLPPSLRVIELSGAVTGPAAYLWGRGVSRRERARRAAKERRAAKARAEATRRQTRT
jgi:GT2 family glycosyltransferase